MSEWWRYTISDFLMYSARTYYRLVEQYNASLWPVQIVAILLGIGILWLIVRPPVWQGRGIAGLLALLWAWVAFAWMWQRFATINWAATWFAAAFGVQALLLVWFGVIRNELTFRLRSGAWARAGLALQVLAVCGYPLIATFTGRGPAQSEVFGMMPDPTALGTIGVLLLSDRRRGLLLIPFVWCVIGGAMLWALTHPAG
jgi:hypothetical protein